MFEPIIVNPDQDAFTGAFITQESYVTLLRLLDSYFSLDMLTQNRKLPCTKHSYMLISKSEQSRWVNVGRKVSLTVTKILHNPNYGIAVAFVYLKTNFTCNAIPHIVLAKEHNINRATVNNIIQNANSGNEVVQLEAPLKIHGRIGVLIDSGEEIVMADRVADGIQHTHCVVTRPEVTLSVEQPPPFQQISSEEYRDRNKPAESEPEPVIEAHGDDLSITVEPTNRKRGNAVPTGDTYKDCPVMKGPRGGMFVIKDDKKIYVTPSMLTKEKEKTSKGSSSGKSGLGGSLTKSGAVYRVNMLD